MKIPPLILALVALCIASPAFAGTPKGVLNPDGSITYTVLPNGDIPQHPGPLAAVVVGNTGVGSYYWQPMVAAPGLAVGDEYRIDWDRTWRVTMRAQGQYLWDVGGEFAGWHWGTSYSGSPEHVHQYTPPAGSRELTRRERNLFVGRGDVGLEWDFATGNSGIVTAWSESTGFVGTGYAANSLGLEFQVTYYPATL